MTAIHLVRATKDQYVHWFTGPLAQKSGTISHYCIHFIIYVMGGKTVLGVSGCEVAS